MIELKVTKTRLTDYLRVFKLVLGICDKFIITNDIIQPVEITDEIVTGAHRIRHPIFPVTSGYVFESVGNIKDIIKTIQDKKGVTNITIVNDTSVLSIRLDYDEYILAISTGSTDSTKTFDEIVNKYILDNKYNHYPKNDLFKARLGEVITVTDETFGSVRLSKSSFPFIGVARVSDGVTFSGKYAFGVFDEELCENYIASHMSYKYCEALHMYVYIPYNN